jgi:predicted phosphodiesterase
MWIGVIADTFGEVAPRVHQVFQGMDYILHCGGIGSMAVLEELSNLAPVTGVLGESDDPHEFPLEETLLRKDFGIPILIRQKMGTPSRPDSLIQQMLLDFDPKVLLFGQSTEACNAVVSDRLWFYPGIANVEFAGPGAASVDLL